MNGTYDDTELYYVPPPEPQYAYHPPQSPQSGEFGAAGGFGAGGESGGGGESGRFGQPETPYGPYHVPPAGAPYAWGVPQAEPDPAGDGWDPVEELAQMLSGASAVAAAAVEPAVAPAGGRRRHRTGRRKEDEESSFLDGGRRVTHVTALIAAIALSALAMLWWSISYSYDQLRAIAGAVLPPEFARWWPLTVYGPWLVAALSVLRATVQQRSARRSWGIVLVASAMAVALSVSHSSRSLLGLVIVGIPPLTALVCFWELVGQVSVKQRTRHRRAVSGEGPAGTADRPPRRPHRAAAR
ncbi:DUF2637 domain-containing protein [Streptomyces sp. NPDC047000]|uniref:DUF2637 domain-containing protein n=1 Tax=Streptomyces sp. NPDC047000 TaxID=3155474 RepID=UPI0033E22FF2